MSSYRRNPNRPRDDPTTCKPLAPRGVGGSLLGRIATRPSASHLHPLHDQEDPDADWDPGPYRAGGHYRSDDKPERDACDRNHQDRDLAGCGLLHGLPFQSVAEGVRLLDWASSGHGTVEPQSPRVGRCPYRGRLRGARRRRAHGRHSRRHRRRLLGGSALQVSGPAAGMVVLVAGLIAEFSWPVVCAISTARLQTRVGWPLPQPCTHVYE